MPFTPQQLREHREKLKAKGICTRCHKHPAKPTGVICAGCAEQGLKHMKESRKDKTRCHHCTCQLDEFTILSGGTYCPRCLETSNLNNTMTRG